MTVTSLWPSTVTARITARLPARQQIDLSASVATSILRGQTTAALASISCIVYGPTGTLLANFTLNSFPSGWSKVDGGASPFSVFTILVPASVYAGAGGGAGVYTLAIVTGSGAEYQSDTVAWQWGGWIDTLMADAADAKTAAEAAETAAGLAQSAAEAAAADAEIARKCLTNRIEPDSSSAPTSLTLYDDDGTTPLLTRTIATASATAVSPDQILSLGALEEP